MLTADQFLRFEAKVFPEPMSGCWLWDAAADQNGYGQFHVSMSKRQHAHRVAYEHYKGPIPDGLQIDHLCRNRSCVNPDHLEAVTISENCRRSSCWHHLINNPSNMSVRNAQKTECSKGHALDRVCKTTGRRYCSTCNKANGEKYRATNPNFKAKALERQKRYLAKKRAAAANG